MLLALFEDRVDDCTKAAMVHNLARPPKPTAPKRLSKKTFNHRSPLEDHVTSRSLRMFDLLSATGREEAKQFLSKSPADWPDDAKYQAMNEGQGEDDQTRKRLC